MLVEWLDGIEKVFAALAVAATALGGLFVTVRSLLKKERAQVAPPPPKPAPMADQVRTNVVSGEMLEQMKLLNRAVNRMNRTMEAIHRVTHKEDPTTGEMRVHLPVGFEARMLREMEEVQKQLAEMKGRLSA